MLQKPVQLFQNWLAIKLSALFISQSFVFDALFSLHGGKTVDCNNYLARPEGLFRTPQWSPSECHRSRQHSLPAGQERFQFIDFFQVHQNVRDISHTTQTIHTILHIEAAGKNVAFPSAWTNIHFALKRETLSWRFWARFLSTTPQN